VIALALATVLAIHPAPECTVALESHDEVPHRILRLRPSCPIGHSSTHAALRALLAHADATEARVSFGRIVEYPWLSSLLAREASVSRNWNAATGRPVKGHENQWVAQMLRAMPEFTVLFDSWQLAGVSVEKVLIMPAAKLPLAAGAPVPPNARLPYDAILFVTLRRQAQ
jgi:hypothetical protein